MYKDFNPKMKIKNLLLPLVAALLCLSNILVPIKTGATGGSGAGTQTSATSQAALAAVKSASTLSQLSSATQSFLSQYSISYSTAQAPANLGITGNSLTSGDFTYVQNLDIELIEEWSKYTTSWVSDSGLQAIYANTSVAVNSQYRCASFSNSLQYIVYDAHCSNLDIDMRHDIHHEFAHYLEYNKFGSFAFDTSTWQSYNPSGFSYGQGGSSCYTNPDSCTWGTHPTSGFVSGYAMSAIEEDQAETYAYLYTTPDYLNLQTWIPADSNLNQKVNRYKAFILSVDPTMDDAYFTQIHTYAAANTNTVAPPFGGPGTLVINPDTGDSIWTIPAGTDTGGIGIGVGASGDPHTQTLILDGTVNDVCNPQRSSGVEVFANGVLKGNGTASCVKVYTGGVIAPGHSPGCLTMGSLTMNGTYNAQIGGTTACTGYDQLIVTGPVDVTGGTLITSLVNSFIPSAGNSFTIIKNNGGNPVIGTFNGLPENTTFSSGGVTYSITYKGGSGNDIVLTVMNVNANQLPKTPNTGFTLIAAYPAVPLSITIICTSILIYLARRIKKVAPK